MSGQHNIYIIISYVSMNFSKISPALMCFLQKNSKSELYFFCFNLFFHSINESFFSCLHFLLLVCLTTVIFLMYYHVSSIGYFCYISPLC